MEKLITMNKNEKSILVLVLIVVGIGFLAKGFSVESVYQDDDTTTLTFSGNRVIIEGSGESKDRESEWMDLQIRDYGDIEIEDVEKLPEYTVDCGSYATVFTDCGFEYNSIGFEMGGFTQSLYVTGQIYKFQFPQSITDNPCDDHGAVITHFYICMEKPAQKTCADYGYDDYPITEGYRCSEVFPEPNLNCWVCEPIEPPIIGGCGGVSPELRNDCCRENNTWTYVWNGQECEDVGWLNGIIYWIIDWLGW